MTNHSDDARISELKEQFKEGQVDRREFVARLIAIGVSSVAAIAILAEQDAAASVAPPPDETKTFRVTGYNIHLGDKLLITVGGQAIAPRAIIECTGDNGEQLNLHFLSTARPGDENNSDMHPNTTTLTDSRTLGMMFLPVQQYTWYVDLLRNEDPVYATLDSARPLNNRVWCAEHVGDGELREIVS